MFMYLEKERSGLIKTKAGSPEEWTDVDDSDWPDSASEASTKPSSPLRLLSDYGRSIANST